MATLLANATLWGFLAYVKRNPYKSVGGMTFDDLMDMADMYIDINDDENELSTTAGYDDSLFPTFDGTGTQAADTAAAGGAAMYPERHNNTG